MTSAINTTGSCLCGAVSYTLKAEPLRAAQCHCKQCQRHSGTGHMTLAFFNEDDVDISGETSEYGAQADSGNTNIRIFCPTCGSRVFGRNSGRPGVISLSVGSADNSDWYKPAAAVYDSCRQPWDQELPDAPKFDAMPPAPK